MNWKQVLIGKWSWKRPFFSIASIYLLLGIFAVFFADRVIFLPPTPSYSSSIVGYTIIPASNGHALAAIHLRARAGLPTIIYSHGNAEDIGQLTEIFEALHEYGYGIIAYDYPGYGLSTGKPSESSTKEAIQDAWNYALNCGIKPSSIIILGRSIGSGPSIWLTSRNQPAALILISPLKSVYSVPFHYPIFPRDRFPNYQLIKSIKTPLLVIHGEKDDTIPYSHGQAIYQASPAKIKSFKSLPQTSHNDLFYNQPEEVFDSIASFIESLTQEK